MNTVSSRSCASWRFPAHPVAVAGIPENRHRPNGRDWPAGGQSEAGTIYRWAVFRRAGEGRVYSEAREV